MTDAQRVLIALLKKSLFNFEVEIPDNTDWQEVYDEANFQSVIPLAFDGTAGVKGIPADIYKKFKNHTVAVMLNNDNVINGQKELTKLLEKNNVKYAILKGTSVARYYPKPELRTLGDVDFLVAKEDFDSTKQLLIDNEYTLTEDEFNHFHCAFSKNGVTFELHFEMSEFPDNEVCNALRNELNSVAKDAMETNFSELSFYALRTLFQAVSLLLHMERHLRKSGLGIRQLMDWGVFEKAHPELLTDESNVVFLKKYGLYRFAIVSKNTFEKYFLDKDIVNESAEDLFEIILKKGNFGAKRTSEQTYATYMLSSNNKSPFKWFNYFKTRSLYSWKATKNHKWLSNFAFIVLPIRYLVRVLFRKRKMINYNELISESDSMSGIVKDLGVFKNDSEE